MNKQRRKALQEIASRIEKAKEIMDNARTDLDMLADEEREAYENLPESMQDGEKGMNMDEAASEIENKRDECEEAFDTLETLAQEISDIAENY